MSSKVGFEVLMAAVLKRSILWDIIPCSQYSEGQPTLQRNMPSIFMTEQ
jgi:hypothetical protein